MNTHSSSLAILPRGTDGRTSYDLHRLLLEAAEEMNFDLPEFQPVERITTGITEIGLVFLILAGLVAIGGLSLL